MTGSKTDFRMDPSRRRLCSRRRSYLQSSISPPRETESSRLFVDRLCRRCSSSGHLRHTYIPNGRVRWLREIAETVQGKFSF